MPIDSTDIHKKSWLNSIFTYGKWYIFSAIFVKGINIILLPIYTRYLSPAEYGILNGLNAIALLLPIFISLYLDSAFGRFFHDAKKNENDLRRLFSTVYWFVLVFGSFVVSITLLTSHFWIPGLLKIPVWPYAFLAFIPPLFLQLGQLGIVFLRQSLMAKQTAILEISSTIITVVVTLLLLVGFKLGVIARLWGGVASSLFLGMFYTVYFYRHKLLRITFDRRVLYACLSYSVPLLPNIAGGWVSGLSDRLVLAKYRGLESVGLYSLAYQLAMILYFIQDAITQVQSPLSISGLIYDREATKKKIAKSVLFLLVVMLTAHLGLVLFSREIISVLATPEYYEAYKVVSIIGFIYVLSGLHRVFTDIIAYHQKTWIISVGAIIMGFSSLSLNFIFVPRYGYFASAFISVLAALIYSSWIFYWANVLEKMNLYWKEMMLIFVTYLFGVIIALRLLQETSHDYFMARFLLAGVFAGVVFSRLKSLRRSSI